MSNTPTLVIAMPTHDGMIHASTVVTMAKAVAHANSQGYRVAFPPLIISGSILPEQRNKLVEAFLETEAKYLLFVDSDMVLDDDSITDILRCNRVLVSGMYFKRQHPFTPIHGIRQADGRYSHTLPKNANDMFPVDGAGAGFLLIHRKVFDAIKPPYFSFEYEKRGDEYVHCGEDYYFCRKAKEAGFETLVDPKIRLGHESKQVIELTDHLIALEQYIASKKAQDESDNSNHEQPTHDDAGDKKSEPGVSAERPVPISAVGN